MCDKPVVLWALVFILTIAGFVPVVDSLGYDETDLRTVFVETKGAPGRCNTTVSIYEDVTTPALSSTNYKRPLTCWYKLKSNSNSDNVIDIRFKKFSVGQYYNSSSCQGGYLQIIDGTPGTSATNHLSPGFVCEEMQHSRNFISETNSVKLIFHAESYSENTFMTFFSRTELKSSFHERFGEQPEIYSNGRLGKLVGVNTYCERVLSQCRPDSCMVQSPGYPGPYPRNLNCRYHISVDRGYIKLFSGDKVINVDGQKCDNIMTCPIRPLITDERGCSRDWIAVFDGKSELDPKIGTFCGFGRMPFSITGSGRHLMVVFQTSPAGSLISTGFQIPVGSVPAIPGNQQGRRQGQCDIIFSGRRLRRSGQMGGQLTSLVHWYPANTTCRYIIRAEPGHQIRLKFTSFRVKAPSANALGHAIAPCTESLSVYDGATKAPGSLVRFFCNTLSAPTNGADIISSGRNILIVFNSLTGSFDASSLFYRASFEFFQDSWWGKHVPDSWCDELITPEHSGISGRFGGPRNRLLLEGEPGELSDPDTRCRYVFNADPRQFQRLLINITSVDLRQNCPDGTTDAACYQTSNSIISDSDDNSLCVCRQQQLPRSVLTHLPNISLHLSMSSSAAQQAMKDGKAIFHGEYHFINNPYCGDPQPKGETFQYPALEYDPKQQTYCTWELKTERGADLWFRVDKLLTMGHCRHNRLRVFIGAAERLWKDICASDSGSSYVLPAHLIPRAQIVQFHLQAEEPGAQLHVRWSALTSTASVLN